jgi:hypothetical protein
MFLSDLTNISHARTHARTHAPATDTRKKQLDRSTPRLSFPCPVFPAGRPAPGRPAHRSTGLDRTAEFSSYPDVRLQTGRPVTGRPVSVNDSRGVLSTEFLMSALLRPPRRESWNFN